MSPDDSTETLTVQPEEHVVLRDLAEVSDPIDPRITSSQRPSNEVLDEAYIHQLSDYVHRREHHHDIDVEKKSIVEEEPVYIEFEKNDNRDPANFSRVRKWTITAVACYFTALTASSASSYSLGTASMMDELNCTSFQATIGLSLYALGFAVVPLVTASFSEEFGRQPLYVVSTIGFALMHLGIALSQNIQSVLILRFLAGAFGSTGSTMVGGTVADIWRPSERGLPMCLFAVSAIFGTGIGPVASGWIELTLKWRWIQWIHLIAIGILIVLVVTLMRETRSSVLLTRIAKKLRKSTGNHQYRARIEDERASLRTLIYISCTRPLYLMVTEPTVASFSLWVGFAWGVLYALIESVSPVFKELHNFGVGETGTVFVTICIGSITGFFATLYQEKLYQKHVGTKGPEARLYAACAAGIVFPCGMFIYAWCTFTNVHWIGLCVGITIVMWALFIIYLAVFTYLADCYGPFASSALAGQSLCRNLMGMAFPLFTNQMYDKLTFKWGNTLFALIATLMLPIPWILFIKGPQIRARSKFASQVIH